MTEKARVLKTEHAFVWAFGIGLVLISGTKLIARGQPILGGIVAAALGIAIMFWYRNNQRRVRPEREQPHLGDEVYYLGLLYTLTSLCAALVSLFLLFGGEQTLEERTDEMIGSFGIALLTTMAGIVMRMTLQRHGAEGQETIIRIPHSPHYSSGEGVEIQGVTVDLEHYAHELRRQLQNSTNAFASHANQTILQAKNTHAHMDEMMQAFQNGLKEKAKAQLESLKAIYKAIAEKAEEARQRTDAQGEGIQSALVVDFRNPYTVSWIRVCAYNKVVSPTALGGSRCLDQSRSINPSLRRRRSRKLAGLHDNERHPAPRFTGQRWSWSCRSIRTSRTRSLPRELGSTRER